MGIFCLISIKVYRKLFLRNIFTKFKDKNIGLFVGGSGLKVFLFTQLHDIITKV
jgi:hypothetical protein